jgi:hypothetical protein
MRGSGWRGFFGSLVLSGCFPGNDKEITAARWRILRGRFQYFNTGIMRDRNNEQRTVLYCPDSEAYGRDFLG